MKAVRWTFLRHGESLANAEGWIAGHTDTPLTDRGRQQALSVRDPLVDIPFERVLVSDLQRAYQTARLAVPEHDPVVHAGLRERSMGDWEGRQRSELDALGMRDAILSETGRAPGGESHQELMVRALRALAELDAPVDTLVVAHGGVLRAVLGALDQMDAAHATRIRFPNVGIQTRAVVPGTWSRLLVSVVGPATGEG